jgi:tetratricopeptide (TPR) repeat protein
VAKHQSKHGSQQQISSIGTEFTEKSFGMQLKELLDLKKYRQALEEIKKIQRSQPEIEFTPQESELRALQGEFREAIVSWQQALKFDPQNAVVCNCLQMIELF